MRVIFQGQSEWFVPETTRVLEVMNWERFLLGWQQRELLRMVEERLEQEQ